MRVLGIDPGLTRCGVAVISGAPGRRLDALHIWVITTSPDLALPERLLLVEQALEALVEEFEPEVVAVDEDDVRLRDVGVAAESAGRVRGGSD